MFVSFISGHAGHDNLLLGEQEAQSQGIAQLLWQCPNLKLVVLNGCSTREQVTRLLNEEGDSGVPVVIATSRPVQDEVATQFAISFYQALGKQFDNIGHAFEVAMGAVNTVNVQEYDEPKTRGRVQLSKEESDPLWGIYTRKGREQVLDWSLPRNTINDDHEVFKPNVLLFDTLFETLAREKTEIAELQSNKELLGEGNIDVNQKQVLVLLHLPHPVSEQLRKLIAPGEGLSGMTFYDKLGEDRLRQLIWCYKATLEFLVFVLLSQLWDIIKMSPDGWKLTKGENEILLSIFKNKQLEGEGYPDEKAIKLVLKLLKGKESEYYLRELAIEKVRSFPENAAFHEACLQLAIIQEQVAEKKKMARDQAKHLCASAEKHLAELFKHIGFISRYMLKSIKNIDVRKQRHLEKPKFIHQVVKLEQNVLGRHSQVPDVLDDIMENGSVILVRCRPESCCPLNGTVKGREDQKYLNLTPFIFDENAYNEKAPLAKIHFFHRYDKEEDLLVFHHIYKAKDDPFQIDGEGDYRVIRAQFDTFAKLLFNQPLKQAL